MTPAQIAKNGTESAHQRALFAWAALNTDKYPELKHLMFHIPNGGSRGGDARSRAIRGATLKSEGVRPGVPDIFISVPRSDRHGLYIEMKCPGGRVSVEQSSFIAAATAAGYRAVVCWGWEHARDEIVDYIEG